MTRTGSLAGWQSGHAAACKAVYAGSIPTPASSFPHLQPPGTAYLDKLKRLRIAVRHVCYYYVFPVIAGTWMRGRRRSWTDAELIAFVAESTSMAQVLRRLGLRAAGGNYEQVKVRINSLRLTTEHWTGQAHLRGKTNPHVRRHPLQSILRRGTVYQSNKLRKRLLREGVLEPKCSSCGGVEWRGGLIPLELDHVDGDKTNNQLDNIRLICPNCHALTPTYRGKNTKYPHIPAAEGVREGIKRNGSMAAYAREMKVSSDTVRSWLQRAVRG